MKRKFLPSAPEHSARWSPHCPPETIRRLLKEILVAAVLTAGLALAFPGTHAQSRYPSVVSMAALPDGKLFVLGSFVAGNSLRLGPITRLNQDGSIDASFLAKIPSATGIPYVQWASAQPDGKVLISGSIRFEDLPQSIARLNLDGSLDTTFRLEPTNAMVLRLIGLLPNGDILAANYINRRIVQLQPNGSLRKVIAGDNYDSYNSLLLVGFQPSGNAVVRAGDGILYAISDQAAWAMDVPLDTSYVPPAMLHDGSMVGTGTDLRLYKARPDGTLDPAFNVEVVGGGQTYPKDWVRGHTVDHSGNILLWGGFTRIAGISAGPLARLTPEGQLDDTFSPSAAVNDLFRAAVAANVQYQIPFIVTPQGTVFALQQEDSPNDRLSRITREGGLDKAFSEKLNASAATYSKLVSRSTLPLLFTLSADQNRRFTIETSTDLKTWSFLTQIDTDNDETTFNAPFSARQAFFRAVALP